MSDKVVVYKGRVNVLQVSLGYDVSSDIISSEIRSEPDVMSPLIARWIVSFKTDGVDGKLILTLDDTSRSITAKSGYMDLKRVSGGNIYSVFDSPVEVLLQGTVTE